MHPAERAGFEVRRQVALNDIWVEAMYRKFVHAKRARKKTTFILMPFEVDDKCAAERGFNKNHFGKITLRQDLSRAICPKKVLINLPRADQVFELSYAGKTARVKDFGDHIDPLKNIA